jgi:hypothetical protein
MNTDKTGNKLLFVLSVFICVQLWLFFPGQIRGNPTASKQDAMTPRIAAHFEEFSFYDGVPLTT